MRLLLDSSGSCLVCALADGCGIVAEQVLDSRSEQARDVDGVIGPILGELGPQDLRSITVGQGPGSFIGTRVAISFANGYGAASGLRVRGVNSLKAIAAVYGNGSSVVLRDARRNSVYWYRGDGPTEQTRLVLLKELPEALQAGLITKAVVEEPIRSSHVSVAFREAVSRAASEAGVQVVPCPGVPAEGLRRLEATAAELAYVEPIYLRDFL